MGDVLHTLPAVTALRRERPDAVIDWVIDERWEPLLRGDEEERPVVDKTIVVQTRRWKAHPFSWSTLRDFLAFRKLQGSYDFVVDMQGTLRSGVIGWLSNGGHHDAEVVGFSSPREEGALRFYNRTVGRRGRHIVEQNAVLLSRGVGVPLEPAQVGIPRTEWAEEWAAQEVIRRPMAVLAPAAGWRGKQWPAEHFAELAVSLRDRGYDVVVNAPREGDALANEVAQSSGGAARVVVCNVAGLIALMRRADLCVGGDSGPMHLAASLAVPVVALFGPTNPERNGPWGPGPSRVLRNPRSPTTYKRMDTPDPGLERIRVMDVLKAVDEIVVRPPAV
jgi:heptosyltransferase-1